MKVIVKMRMFCQKLLINISEPVIILLQALQKLLRGVLTALVGAPAEAVDSMGQRVLQRAGKVDASLDAKADAKKERNLEKKLDAALQRLYYTDSFLLQRRSMRRWKNFWILLIEFVSFFTTYRGLNQLFSALHFVVPLLLAVVIQTAVGYLSAVASNSDATPKQKGLLAVVLCISVAFSFVGVMETFLPYADYAQAQYAEFSRVYRTVKDRGNLAVEGGGSPVAELNSQYAKVDQLLADANSRYSDEELEKANEVLSNYENMTISMVVDRPDQMYRDKDGYWIRGSGGSQIEFVPDPDAKPLIQEAQKKVDFLEEQRRRIGEIRALLQGGAAQALVAAAVERQLEADGSLLPEFMEARHAAQLLWEKCEELADEMQSPITLRLNLEEILQSYRNVERLSDVEDIRPFQEVYAAWKDAETQPGEIGIKVLDATLAVMTVNDPSQLRESLNQEVEMCYGALLPALEYVGEEELAGLLKEAYHAYNLELPMLYAFHALPPGSENSGIAALALIVAIINDGLAVLIGFWIEQSYMNWFSKRTIGANDLTPHVYSHFRAVIMPELRRRIGWDFTFEKARDAFADILENYLARFKLKPLLIREGFTRCCEMTDDDPGFEKFCGFLLRCGMAKPICQEDVKTLGLVGADDPNAQYILLSSRAEGWIVDLLGNAAELGYNELACNT